MSVEVGTDDNAVPIIMSYETVCWDCGMHKFDMTKEEAMAEETCHFADTGHDVETMEGLGSNAL